MKMSEFRSHRRRPVHTLKQLKLEQQRLQHEIDLKELEIKQDYRSLIDIFTFRNILDVVIDYVLNTSSLASRIYSLIKPWLGKRRRTKDEGRRTRDEGRRTKDEGRRTRSVRGKK